jgi:anthranilate phosphoribosyltransferase
VIEVAEGRTEEWFADPEELGLATAPLDAIAGGEPADNARAVREVFEGGRGAGRDVVVLNAGAAILAGGAASDLAEGIAKAGEAIDSGAALAVLERLVETTSSLSGE